MRRADNFTTFMCRLSWNPGDSTFWNPQGLSRPVMGLLYLLPYVVCVCVCVYILPLSVFEPFVQISWKIARMSGCSKKQQRPPSELFCQLTVDLDGYHRSWPHSNTHTHSVGLLWTSDQPIAETSTWQHTTLTRDRHPCRRRDSNPQSQQASGRRPTP